ncbi:EP300-interacting inhibitor of differentiation 3-like [Octopus sinensis]|uniref:Non-structural maintenance of chromosomes element 4 n=1 Tax=Octopus sinensis TaxID=2607531 RepID=A0A6P7TDJ1_9MOLL|nr:EP300-interacting inhibitor of differentiation 3-like [Octopus sinensis]
MLPGGGNLNLSGGDASDLEKRQIRQNYRSLIEELNANKEDLINPSSDALDVQLSKAELYSKPVFGSTNIRTREAALDSYALNLISGLGKQKAQALNTEFIRFQPLEYTDKLKNSLGSEHLESLDGERMVVSRSGWITMGQDCSYLFARFTPLHLLYGSFDPGVVKMQRHINRRPRDKENSSEKATVPKQISKFGDIEKNEATTEEVERVLKCLRDYHNAEGKEPICYFRFVVNPDSFGQTVENIFHVSFLVRDGLAKVYLDGDNLPVIEPVGLEENKSQESTKRTRQCVISISPAEWRAIKKTFDLRTAMIPSRAPLETNRSQITAATIPSPTTSSTTKTSSSSATGRSRR